MCYKNIRLITWNLVYLYFYAKSSYASASIHRSFLRNVMVNIHLNHDTVLFSVSFFTDFRYHHLDDFLHICICYHFGIM